MVVALVRMLLGDVGWCVVEIDDEVRVVEAQELDPSCQGFVSQFLLPPPIHFLLISARRVVIIIVVVVVVVAHGNSPPGEWRRDDIVHMCKTVGFDGVVVEPRAIARFPFEAADHAELGAATARHVVAAFFEFDGGGTVEAALPALLFGDPDELLRRCVLGAFPARVPFVVARAADFHPAPLASAELTAVVGAAAGFDVDVGWFDPGAATPSGAIEAVFGGIFFVLSVPLLLETVVE